ncbi:arylamine N-acetyltransferase [Aurantiacibacter sp. MUD11]|uniref:arylamine N-acetyltransferase family protein n=1 Tax=Aurantiacibacter sp. MUD11 TaxID=3003265 RepID=UPI0022AB2D5F|nr:arylamine N-acetyltransferase [Aurantiacibacter sp. MUD11]WAT16909.1 arylamine N-acetyltransferase [Aurantiacibacter sp. MUD11]
MALSPQLSDYLARIGLDKPPAANAAGLEQVQAAHRQHIPFENLDIPLDRTIHCDGTRVFAKLVTARRGGYCFEQNRLFADMLADLGFTNRLLLARVLLGDPPDHTPRTHCLVLVTIEGEEWIADAGFGGAYAPPMRLRDGEEARSGDGARHRLTRIGEQGDLPGAWLLERQGPIHSTDGRARSADRWEAQFAFDLAQVAQADMALGNHWAATHDTSRFTNVVVASKCLPDGFTRLVGRELTSWRAGQDKQQATIDHAAAYQDVLAREFGIALRGEEVTRLALFAE